MIKEITIDDNFEDVYDLSSFELDGELIISNNEKYILTSENYFSFYSIDDFLLKNNDYILRNDNSIYKISKEKFEMLKNIITKS